MGRAVRSQSGVRKNGMKGGSLQSQEIEERRDKLIKEL